MTGKSYYTAGILLTAAALAATVVAYPRLPDSVPTHWNIQGLPNVLFAGLGNVMGKVRRSLPRMVSAILSSPHGGGASSGGVFAGLF
jgi:hypothetical protein